ncbi:NAD(P)/FAD-dependent oxidoreductase [Gulosibacter molinativorax]|uniref:FAD-binding oxidoreductase n=1 Tax=Gulosibacter molinativorax TaxID=256821 RepID=A0ABT7C7Q4_9MICO|nr:FAD-binding oxidoreductase [Gulosibacter molinativorax]MDJ1371158.1 FAD-binding oxidoreductase [Gulosibacter molinativorax]QUY62974.1 4-methylaminobutanoate oxidase (Formaldehyde-forming) [Gulosibacter molinativorax]
MRYEYLDNCVPLVPELPAQLPANASVVILGGGIMGVCTAYELAKAGVRDVVVLERDALGSGSSAKPLGGVRATFSDPGNVVLGRRSLETFERMQYEENADFGLRQVGYLFLCRSDAEVASVEASVQVQNSLGCNSRMVSPTEAAEINPFLNSDALVGASFSPRDGYAQPSLVVAEYARRARELGAQIFEHTEVIGLGASDDGVDIHTQRGEIHADSIVIAAGAWSTALGAMVGVNLPIEPVRRQIGFTPQLAEPHPTVPFTLDLSTTMYFHNHRNGMLLGISNEEEPGFQREFSYNWVDEFNAAAEIIAPDLSHQPLEAGWAGLYENTPDHNAMIGRDSSRPNILYATGFSGHGFLQGPAVGELIRDLYLDRESFLDPIPFSADRFAGTQARLAELHII